MVGTRRCREQKGSEVGQTLATEGFDNARSPQLASSKGGDVAPITETAWRCRAKGNKMGVLTRTSVAFDILLLLPYSTSMIVSNNLDREEACIVHDERSWGVRLPVSDSEHRRTKCK